MNEPRNHAELHLAILGPRESYQYTAKNFKTKDVKNDFLRKDEVTTVLFNLNEKGYTTWLSINDKERDSIEGVKALCDFWLDIDARPKGVDDRTATEEELKASLDRADKLKNHIENQYAAIGFMAKSGNGFHIHFPLPRCDLDPELRNQVNLKVRFFAKTVSTTVKAEIDNTYDINRKTTLIGTANKKIPDKPLATGWDSELLSRGLEAALKYVENARNQNKILLETILATEDPKTAKKTLQPTENHLDIEQLLRNDQKLYDLLKVGDYKKYNYKSRSEGEQAILTTLVLEGFPDEDINTIMESCAIGKWQEREESYRNLSLQHAREYASKIVIEKKGEERNEDEALNPVTLAKEIQRDYTFAIEEQSRMLFVYDAEEGRYDEHAEELMKREIARRLDDEARAKYYNDVFFFINATTPIIPICESPELLICKNGVLDVLKRELKPFSPDLFLTSKIPVTYDPEAKCPKLQQFLEEVIEKDQINTLQELVGYTLYRKITFHKSALLVGNGRNGKGTTLKLLEALLGQENRSTETIQDLCYNRFSKANLYLKMANISADLPSNKLEHTGMYKMLVAGDAVNAERKGKTAFPFIPIAKHFYSANQIPPIARSEDCDAFYARWIIIEFTHQFLGKNAKKDLITTLTTPEELSGFLNWALDGLKRLIENNDFSATEDIKEARKQYTKRSDPVKAFIEECIETTNEFSDWITVKQLYQKFLVYCRQEKIGTRPQRVFTEGMKENCEGADYRKTRLSKEEQATCGEDHETLWAWHMIKCSFVPDVPDVPPFHIRSKKTENKNNNSIEFYVPNRNIGTNGTSGTETEPTPEPTVQNDTVEERTCGQCALWHKPGCTYPGSEYTCVAPTNKFAVDCRDFLEKRRKEAERYD